jgi:CMP-N-acetylneuraminic acid synthetase
MSFLIFIPARSGSTRLKNKNIKFINNKPLIKYTIDVSKKLNIKDIFCSTDSLKIKKICKENGFFTRYKRPKKISKKLTTMTETVLHGAEWYKKNVNSNIKNIILLQPTFPMRNLKVIKKSINLFKQKKLKSLSSISELKIDSSCLLYSKDKKNFSLPKNKNKDKVYKIDGNFYICSLNFLKDNKKFSILGKTKFVNSQVKFPVDIDYLEDFIIAKNIIENVNKK